MVKISLIMYLEYPYQIGMYMYLKNAVCQKIVPNYLSCIVLDTSEVEILIVYKKLNFTIVLIESICR